MRAGRVGGRRAHAVGRGGVCGKGGRGEGGGVTDATARERVGGGVRRLGVLDSVREY